MEFTEEGVVLDKPLNELDRLVLDVVEILENLHIRYAVVSGYVAVLFGRARATEDIDVIVEPFDEPVADELALSLQREGFWGSAMPLDELYETLADELPIRVAEEGHRVPNVELKFATDEYDQMSLDNTILVQLPDGTLQVGSIELQIAYKLDMGAQKDFEDALYLYEVIGSNVNQQALETYVRRLGVEEEYGQLRAT